MLARKATRQIKASVPVFGSGASASRASGAPLSGRSIDKLGWRAKALVLKKAAKSPKRPEALEPGAVRKVVSEPPLPRAELTMRNEAWPRTLVAADFAPARYFDLFELAPVGYCVINSGGRIVKANLCAAVLMGVARGELENQPFTRFICSRDQRVFGQFRKQLVETGEAQCCELRLLKPDQSLFWVQLNATTAPDTSHAPEIRMVLSDIAELKRTEEALRAQEEFFHLIAESIDDFIAVLDLSGRRIYNSPSYRHFFGSPFDLRGTDSFAEIHPEDRERVKQVFRETVQTGVGQQIVYRLQLADGSVHDMESSGNVIRDSEGRVVRVVVVSRDITERKRMEDQVRQLAFYDPLTQLPNRRLLADRLDQAIAASRRSLCCGAIMFLDLDNFKALNDAQGHTVGDLLLVEVAKRLKSCVREMDTVARFGGDEFVLMIRDLDEDKAESAAQARVVAEKIIAALSEPVMLKAGPDGQGEATFEHHCTASIGVVLFADQVSSQDDLLKWADKAMYEAKAAGPNQFRFHQAA